MSGNQRADELFKQGFACSQSVLAGFGGRYGLDEQMALRLARAFGGGVGLGFPCGAVSGALMVLGLSIERLEQGDQKDRYRVYELSQKFAGRFQARHQSIWCKDLLGVDLGTKEGYARAREEEMFKKLCPTFVRSAGEILDELL